MVRTKGRYRKVRGARQHYSSKKNYKKRDRDFETIMAFLFGIPGFGVVTFLLFKFTGFFLFLIASILAGILEIFCVYRAVKNKLKKVERVFT